MRLLDYLDRDSVEVGLRGKTKAEALGLMVSFVIESGIARDQEALLAALNQREGVVTTGIGNGVAIPHADLPGIESPRLVLGTFPEGVDFEALDEEPVFVIFLLLGTPRTPGLHMKILARIARLSKDPEFARLSAAANVEEALGVLERIESRR